jgi:hypothetical protein
MSGIYKGYNPIYESLKKDLFEAQNKVDTDALLRAIYDTFVNTLMNGSDEAVRTPDGFKLFMDKALQSSSIDVLKSELNDKIDELAKLDKNQAQPLNQTKSYLSTLFDTLKSAMGEDTKAIKTVIDKMTEFTGTTIGGLQAVKTQMQQNESLISKYLSEQSETRTGEEANSEEGENGKWYFQLSKNVLDTATSFAGETTAALSNKSLSGDAGIQKFAQDGQDYLAKAKSLSVTGGRKGFIVMGKVKTASGDIKGKDYRIQVKNLINEIIRQREEFQKLKYRLSNIPAPPQAVTVCPTGMTFDTSKNACVYVNIPSPVVNQGEGQPPRPPKPTPPVPTTGCQFPIQITTKKCSEVAQLQGKLMSMGGCIADIINKAGGADGKYGKVTAKLANIAYAYLTKSSAFNPTGDLTLDIYNTIMAGGQMVPTPPATKESLNSEENSKVLENRIFEREYKTGMPVLSFSDFSNVLSEAGYVIDENVAGSGKSIADCICGTYASGQMDAACLSSIVPVPNPTGGTGATGATGATGGTEEPIPTREDWKGLKYVNTGSYPISFDESLLSFWSKEAAITALSFAIPGSGYLLKAGSTGLRSLGIKGAAKLGMTKLAQRIGAGAVGTVAAKATATTATRLSAVSAGYFAKYGAIPIAKRVAGGLIGGAVGGAALDFLSGRDTFVITTVEGFIERNLLLGVAKGLVNTLDGYVSDEDWACISQLLAVIKGGWTVDDGDKAVSAWAELKRLYVESEGEDLVADIQSVSAKMGDVEGFPNMKSVSPLASLNDVDWDLALAETLRFVDVLERNESNMSQNLGKLPVKYVTAHVEGTYQEIDENGEEVDKEGEEGGEETGSAKKSTY